MAEGKKSFILYADLIHIVKKLPEKTRGDLFLLILEYVNDLDPKIENDLLLEISFEPIKQQLKRDLKDWEGEKFDRSNSGTIGNIARWHPDIYKQIIDKQLTIDEAITKIKSHKSQGDKSDSADIANIPRIANIAVNVTDTVTVTENGIHKEEELATTVAVGEKVKEIANKVWEDKIWVEQVCIGLSLKQPTLKKWMALFNASVAQDEIADFTEKRYKRMVRGWILKQKERGTTIEDWELQKTSSAPPLKKL